MDDAESAKPVAGGDGLRMEVSTLEDSSTGESKAGPVDAQAPRRRGRPAGRVSLFEQSIRFQLGLRRALEKYGPSLDLAQAATCAAALAALSERGSIQLFSTGEACLVSFGFPPGLDPSVLKNRSDHLAKAAKAAAMRLSDEEKVWIEASADRLYLLCRSISEGAWATAFIEARSLMELGWRPMLVDICAALSNAPETTVPVAHAGDHIAELAKVSAEKSAGDLFPAHFVTPVSLASPAAASSVDKRAATKMEFDLLRGTKEMAAFTGLSEVQVRHLYTHHGMPIFKLGKTVCITRAALVRWLADRQDEATARSAMKRGAEAK